MSDLTNQDLYSVELTRDELKLMQSVLLAHADLMSRVQYTFAFQDGHDLTHKGCHHGMTMCNGVISKIGEALKDE